MSDTVKFTVSTDRAVKEQCEELFRDLGLNLNIAINLFLRQSLRDGGMLEPGEMGHYGPGEKGQFQVGIKGPK